jgi:hypothetical protein
MVMGFRSDCSTPYWVTTASWPLRLTFGSAITGVAAPLSRELGGGVPDQRRAGAGDLDRELA